MQLDLIFEVVLIGLVLSADSFSAAVAMGMRPFSNKEAFRFAFLSGGAEGVVALFGAITGSQLIKRFEAVDHWIAFILLIAISAHMAFEGIQQLRGKVDTDTKTNFHSLAKIILVSFATSLDAFGVGIGLGVSEKPLAPYIFSIFFWAFTTTLLGLFLAKKLSHKFGPIMSLVGSIVLAILAWKMLAI